nr:MAG TPA: hypothetical protein [Caudoviricetes sp.]
MSIEEFQSKVGLIAEVIKSSLESFNLYSCRSKDRRIYIDRDSYDNGGSGKVGRVKMNQINVRY